LRARPVRLPHGCQPFARPQHARPREGGHPVLGPTRRWVLAAEARAPVAADPVGDIEKYLVEIGLPQSHVTFLLTWPSTCTAPITCHMVRLPARLSVDMFCPSHMPRVHARLSVKLYCPSHMPRLPALLSVEMYCASHMSRFPACLSPEMYCPSHMSRLAARLSLEMYCPSHMVRLAARLGVDI
jgi:hypothetical protein